MEPLVKKEQLGAAYQLNWSLSVRSVSLPDRDRWFSALQTTTELDGIRLLDHSATKSNQQHQFFISTKPHVKVSDIPRLVKGRLQYLLKEVSPRIFSRSYSLQSVGEANDATLRQYVAGQPERHRMADDRVQQLLESLQFDDPKINLSQVRAGKYGRYIANVHLVLETREHYHEIREEALRVTRDVIIRAARKHGHLLSQIGLVSNHMHVLLGCGLSESPLAVAASYWNNICFAHDRKMVLEPSFFVGTFGPYNRDAIRRHLSLALALPQGA